MRPLAIGIIGGITAGAFTGFTAYAEARPREDWPAPQTRVRSTAAFKYGMFVGTPIMLGGAGVSMFNDLTPGGRQAAAGALGIGLGAVAGAFLGRAIGQMQDG